MALDYKLGIMQAPNSKEIWVYDRTGLFSSLNNTTGFGGTNPSVADVNSCSLIITMADKATLQPSTDPLQQFTLDMFGTIPNTSGNKFVVLNTDLGLALNDILIDGEYYFESTIAGTYIVNSTSTPFSFTYKGGRVFYNQLACCCEKAKAKVDISQVNCKPCKDGMFNSLLIGLALDGVISNNNCAKTNKALAILKEATALCTKSGCSGCK